MLFLFLSIHLSSYEFTTSVVIPCYYGHFDLLENLLEGYARQTSIPEEVVIALSEANRIQDDRRVHLKAIAWPFKLVLLETDRHQFAGENRNRGILASRGELVIFQDADDYPHLQRVEAIQECYDKYHFDHLLHQWESSLEESIYFAFPCRQVPLREVEDGRYQLHMGNCAISREVFNEIQWSSRWEGQDRLFTKDVYNVSSSCYVLFLPLLSYQTEKSSLAERFVSAILHYQEVPVRVVQSLKKGLFNEVLDVLVKRLEERKVLPKLLLAMMTSEQRKNFAAKIEEHHLELPDELRRLL